MLLWLIIFTTKTQGTLRNHQEEKSAIAKSAVKLIEPNENIILDTGTTTLYVARELAKSNIVLTVATTSLTVASTLFNTNIDVLLFGGFLLLGQRFGQGGDDILDDGCNFRPDDTLQYAVQGRHH